MKQLPWELEALRAAAPNFQAPTDAFDPQGAWELRYALLTVLPDSQFGHTTSAGGFRIRRTPVGPGVVKHDVRLVSQQNDKSVYHAHAEITSATDTLATPRNWTMRTEIRSAAGVVDADTTLVQTGKVVGGNLQRRNGRAERVLPAPEHFTSNWSLFDAVQRLPVAPQEPLRFDMFEELDLFKPNQRLLFRQTQTVELGRQQLRLHRFEQFGDGILPYTYWLDNQHRLLIAAGGLRVFLFDPSVRLPEDPS